MKRIHIGLEVDNLERSIAFYSKMFGEEPVVREADYAKWTPKEPSVNLSITARGGEPAGSVHFGVEVDGKDGLQEIAGRLAEAGEDVIKTGETVCCYHKSDKAWVLDPDAHRWETFYSTGLDVEYGEDEPEIQAAQAKRVAEREAAKGCCATECG